MKIKKVTEKHTVPFSEVNEGETFRYLGNIYVKLPDIFSFETLKAEFNSYTYFDDLMDDYDYNNCYNLTCDYLNKFSEDTEVELVICELTVYD